ncbi:hypothetical protein AB595_08250 [Massilia sp. WF1]|nr:hypothetical protein AB595_08250 [Massilia sp. WF1]
MRRSPPGWLVLVRAAPSGKASLLPSGMAIAAALQHSASATVTAVWARVFEILMMANKATSMPTAVIRRI